MEIIIGRQGTQKTPITDPTVSRRHCKLTVNPDGTYTLENLSPSGTKVDGVEIIRSTVKPNTRIQLGQSFSATVVELVGAPSQPRVPTTSPPQNSATSQPQNSATSQPQFNISHLRRVYEDFNRTNLEMAEKQRKTNLIRTGLGIFTMCAMPMIFFFGPVGYVLTAIGVIGNIYSFAGMRNAETPEERQRRTEAFEDAWVCPNPECGRSLPARNYKLLVRNHQSCPYCKCRYVER